MMTNKVRLIDANWILREIDHDLGCYEIEEITTNDGLYVELRDVVKMVLDAPTIDPESLRPKGRWISVKDRLPEEGEVVMCYHKVREYPVVCQWDESVLCWINNNWTFGRGLITHWMPLPEPPKEW